MNFDRLTSRWHLFTLAGAAMLIGGLLLLRLVPDDSPLLWIGGILGVGSGLSLVLGLFGAIKREHTVDERFILNRLRATRFAMICTVVAAGIVLIYTGVVENEARYDLMIILGIAAAGKLGGMLYYRLRG